MTTGTDPNQFDQLARPPFTAECRMQAWQHCQHLNLLSDFTARLQYWQNEVSKMGVVYDTFYSDFLLSPNPETEEDEDQLHCWRLDWFRSDLIRRSKRIVKYGWQGFWDDPDGTAFIIKSTDDLVSDLESRLSKAVRKEDLLKRELQEISESIDSACPTETNGLKADILYCIDKLRNSLDTNKPIKLSIFEDTRFAAVGLYQLAEVWDIVHYEAYLKDRLAGPINFLQPSVKQNLTQREQVLIQCYKQLPAITPGEKGYQDYITYARPGDRISYPRESDRKAKALIRSIKKVLSYLTEVEKQQAQTEIDTIEAKFSNQL